MDKDMKRLGEPSKRAHLLIPDEKFWNTEKEKLLCKNFIVPSEIENKYKTIPKEALYIGFFGNKIQKYDPEMEDNKVCNCVYLTFNVDGDNLWPSYDFMNLYNLETEDWDKLDLPVANIKFAFSRVHA